MKLMYIGAWKGLSIEFMNKAFTYGTRLAEAPINQFKHKQKKQSLMFKMMNVIYVLSFFVTVCELDPVSQNPCHTRA